MIIVIRGRITSTLLTLFVLPAISQLLLRIKREHYITSETPTRRKHAVNYRPRNL